MHLARLVWSFSAAYRAHPGEHRYVEMASRAAEALEAMWDRDHGGWVWSTDRWGAVTDDRKRLYGQEFGVFATAEYARASGSDAARRRASDAMEILVRLGAHEGRDDGWTASWDPLPTSGPNPNALLHVMECLVALHGLTGEAAHRDLLRGARDLLRDRVIAETPDGGARLVERLDERWRPIPGPRGHEEKYGHGIEAAWLLLQAAEALGESPAETLPASVALADRARTSGLDDRRGGMFHRGAVDGHILGRRKVWWVQAESLVGFLLLYRETREPRFWDAFVRVAGWVLNRQADRAYGEWFAELSPRGVVLDARKSYRWKSAYHTTRACLEVIRLLADETA